MKKMFKWQFQIPEEVGRDGRDPQHRGRNRHAFPGGRREEEAGGRQAGKGIRWGSLLVLGS